MSTFSCSPSSATSSPRDFRIFAGPVVGWSAENRDQGADQTTTSYGVAAGAGYYIPAGRVFLGPRAQLGYARGTLDIDESEVTDHTWALQGAGALRVPLGFGGVIDLAVVLSYLTGTSTISRSGLEESEEGFSELNVGLAAGFLLFF